ncbi:MAG: LiaI-LiaF-like domain-containing protein [Candidatus Acidiferrales bacterium]
MGSGQKCSCAHCRTRGLMGPVVLITLGVLFSIHEFSGRYNFGELWPVLLIVIGIVMVVSAMASKEGHIGS